MQMKLFISARKLFLKYQAFLLVLCCLMELPVYCDIQETIPGKLKNIFKNTLQYNQQFYTCVIKSELSG